MTKILLGLIALQAYGLFCAVEPLPLYVECIISMIMVLAALPLSRRKGAIRNLALLGVFAYLRYLTFRLGCTMHFHTVKDFIAVVGYLSADLYFLIVIASTAFLHWWREPNDKLDIEPEDIPPLSGKAPAVDVFITTLNEPADILCRTIIGAMAISYSNKKVYVLDDGGRDEIKQLAEDLGANYITRSDRTDFKAGNLNNALAQTDGEFVLQLDADHIAASSILDLAVPKLVHDETAWAVQFAHRYVNPGPVERTTGYLGRDTEMSSSYNVVLPSMARWNAVTWTGSGAVLRRSALDKIGGIATGTVIEDQHTSYKMFQQGLRTIYCPRPQILALSPETVSAYFTQQTRWFVGAYQLYLKQGLYKMPGLTFPQRVLAFFNFYNYQSFLFRFIYMMIPFGVIALNAIPARMAPFQFLAVWLPLIFAVHFRRGEMLYRNNYALVIVETYDALKLPLYAVAFFKGLFSGFKKSFQTTPKGFTRHERSDALLCLSYLILLVPVGGSALVFTWKAIIMPNWSMLLVLFSWYYTIILLAAIAVCFDKPYPITMYSVDADLPVAVEQGILESSGIMVRVSEVGCTIRFANRINLRPDDVVQVSFGSKSLSIKRQARCVASREIAGFAVIDLSFVPSADMVASARSSFLTLAYATNEAWQKPANRHRENALPYLVRTLVRQTKQGINHLGSIWSLEMDKANDESKPAAPV